MRRIKWTAALWSICFFILGATQAFGGEIPPGYEAKGKTVSGIIFMTDDQGIDENGYSVPGIKYWIIGECSKVPFQIGPYFVPGLSVTLIEESYLYELYLADAMLPQCDIKGEYFGLAITGTKNWIKANTAIIAEASLTPVVPITK